MAVENCKDGVQSAGQHCANIDDADPSRAAKYTYSENEYEGARIAFATRGTGPMEDFPSLPRTRPIHDGYRDEPSRVTVEMKHARRCRCRTWKTLCEYLPRPSRVLTRG